jgi:hypothetical protein
VIPEASDTAVLLVVADALAERDNVAVWVVWEAGITRST